jgi:hypothetical protein
MKPMNRFIVIAKGQRPQPWLAYRRGRGPALCRERSRRAPALWRRGEVKRDRLAAGTRARLGGEFSGAGLKDQRRDLLGAVDADPGAEQPAPRAVATRLVRCQSETLAHHCLHAGQRRGGRGLHDGPTTTPSASTSKSSSFHPAERRGGAWLKPATRAPRAATQIEQVGVLTSRNDPPTMMAAARRLCGSLAVHCLRPKQWRAEAVSVDLSQ